MHQLHCQHYFFLLYLWKFSFRKLWKNAKLLVQSFGLAKISHQATIIFYCYNCKYAATTSLSWIRTYWFEFDIFRYCNDFWFKHILKKLYILFQLFRAVISYYLAFKTITNIWWNVYFSWQRKRFQFQCVKWVQISFYCSKDTPKNENLCWLFSILYRLWSDIESNWAARKSILCLAINIYGKTKLYVYCDSKENTSNEWWAMTKRHKSVKEMLTIFSRRYPWFWCHWHCKRI